MSLGQHHLQRDGVRDMLMLGDRGDFLLGQSAHVDAVLNSQHGLRAFFLGCQPDETRAGGAEASRPIQTSA